MQDCVEESHASKCVKFLKNGDIHLVDVEGVASEFSKKPSMGDILQYELHNYCKKNLKKDSNVLIVVKLSNLCYSKVSVLQFSNIDRFVGCLYYITSYLIANVGTYILIEDNNFLIYINQIKSITIVLGNVQRSFGSSKKFGI